MSHPEHEHSELLKIEQWEQESRKVDSICKEGLSRYLETQQVSTEALREVFKHENKTLYCIDEGTEGCFHIAGSGILLEDEVVIQAIKNGGIKYITSHAGCGAAAVAAKAHGETDVDAFAEQYARKIAALAGIEYKGHIKELQRPKEFHNTRVVYYDGTGAFNNRKVEELPTGFIISRAILDKESALKEVALAIQIATGEHGYGNLINNEHPLLVIPIGHSETETAALENEIREAGILSDKVKMDGLIAPQQRYAIAAD